MTLKSPAKINLHLDVGPSRDDGFHELDSVFSMIDLYDVLTVEIRRGSYAVEIEGNRLVPVKTDIMAKAARLFCRISGIERKIRIRICKKIPIGAGLGGGSSDAAGVLKGLNALCGTGLTVEELSRVASLLGSDVAFFLGGPFARVRGRGEIVEPFTPNRAWWVLLVDPGFRVDTGEAYGWLDDDRGAVEMWEPVMGTEGKMSHMDLAAGNFFNSFAPVLNKRFPVIGEVCDTLRQQGAVISSVTGSGSVCFGVFDSYNAASKASLSVSNYRFWLKETLACSHTAVLQ